MSSGLSSSCVAISSSSCSILVADVALLLSGITDIDGGGGCCWFCMAFCCLSCDKSFFFAGSFFSSIAAAHTRRWRRGQKGGKRERGERENGELDDEMKSLFFFLFFRKQNTNCRKCDNWISSGNACELTFIVLNTQTGRSRRQKLDGWVHCEIIIYNFCCCSDRTFYIFFFFLFVSWNDEIARHAAQSGEGLMVAVNTLLWADLRRFDAGECEWCELIKRLDHLQCSFNFW